MQAAKDTARQPSGSRFGSSQVGPTITLAPEIWPWRDNAALCQSRKDGLYEQGEKNFCWLFKAQKNKGRLAAPYSQTGWLVIAYPPVWLCDSWLPRIHRVSQAPFGNDISIAQRCLTGQLIASIARRIKTLDQPALRL